ncbi:MULTISPECIES: nuclear transport factor 2 family protein [unclassified Streptomyces]|uniref:nuclear transport factor 2 family protein n=1 Tax=unclassified Streptomyces TaxID=2593676 RepID=UPI0029A0FA0F|nr:nuclear transport factor 2 family protein [Streptomyces sp. DK15]MDX2391845.1 nuclear transport factor 2 family protein [Streptomyces sp. DK15]
MEPLKVVAQLWERIEARDWDGVTGLIAEDAVIEWPVSGERIVGRANFIAVLRDEGDAGDAGGGSGTGYGGDGGGDERTTGQVEVLRILADGDLVVTEVEIPEDHVLYRAVSLWTVRNGEIVGAREYWTSPGQDPAPRWRAGYVEPLVAD